MSAGNATVRVSRSARGYRDRVRKYKVFVDGVEIGRLKRGATVETVVGPGAHTLTVALDWMSDALDFVVDGHQLLAFHCGPAGGMLDSINDLVEGHWVSITQVDAR
jgi:hypothetical protein